jgi:hypothetical protein
MIGQPTLVLSALAVTLGVSLFLVKYDVQSLEEQLAKIDRQAAADQEAIHVLKAEWSFLTQPERLTDLSGRHLPLHPLTANQIGDFDQLALRTDRPAAPDPAAGRPTGQPIATVPEQDVPIEAVLQAMQLADYRPVSSAAPRTQRAAAVKPRSVQ